MGVQLTTASWLAALIDGEGSVMLTARRREMNWRPVVSIYNTDWRLIDGLVERVGGGVVFSHNRGEKENNKKMAYSWRMRIFEQRLWLPQCLPWLICKKEQVELLLQALDIKTKLTVPKGQSGPKLEERDELRSQMTTIAAEISRLNRRGRVDMTTVSTLP